MTTKVRFHLGRGPNYQRWQVRFGDNAPEYFDPEDVILEMHNAVLRNQRGTAEKILNGDNKTVCAWVACEDVIVRTTTPPTKGMTHYKYNPRKNPHWFTERNDNVDGKSMPSMVTSGRKLFS